MSRSPDRVRRRRAHRAAATAVCALAAWAVSSAWSGAAADAPMKDGWWWAANTGAAIAPPPPPDVPAKGLYVENGFSGPTAIAAVSFAVPKGATVGALTLETAGSPVISTPPVACAITAAGRAYQPVENGEWSAKPAYDCQAAQAKGAVSSDGKEVAFPVAPLVRAGALEVVILATGQADRIPFQPPDTHALAVTAPVTPAHTNSARAALGGAYGGHASTAAAGLSGGAMPAAPSPSTDGTAGVSPLPDAGVAPTVAPASPQAGQPAATSLTAGEVAGGGASGTRVNAATAFGLAAMVAALLFWTEGFGLLGGRVTTLAGRPRRRVRGGEPTVAVPTVSAPP